MNCLVCDEPLEFSGVGLLGQLNGVRKGLADSRLLRREDAGVAGMR